MNHQNSPSSLTITPRDLFAASALNAIIGDKDMVRTGGKALLADPNGFIAKMAFLAADAMMAERAKRVDDGGAA